MIPPFAGIVGFDDVLPFGGVYQISRDQKMLSKKFLKFSGALCTVKWQEHRCKNPLDFAAACW